MISTEGNKMAEKKTGSRSRSRKSRKTETGSGNEEQVKEPSDDSKVRRLYRSKKEKVIAGVCGGIADYFYIDPVWIRIIFVLLALIDGIGVVIYILAVILIPENPLHKKTKNTFAEDFFDKVKDRTSGKDSNRIKESEADDTRGSADLAISDDAQRKAKKHSGSVIFGLILIIAGVVFMLRRLFDWFDLSYVFPILLVLLGIHIISHHRRSQE